MEQNDIYIFSICLFGLGIFFFLNAFKKLKLRKRILDTPTAKINTTAVGENVEIEGMVFCPEEDLEKAPVSGVQSCLFLWTVQEYHENRDKKGGTWKTIMEYTSKDVLFFIDQSKAHAFAPFKDVELHNFPSKTQRFDRSLSDLNSESKHLLKKIGVRPRTFFDSNKLRIIEKYIAKDSAIYVLGSATPNKGFRSKHSSPEWNQLIQSAKLSFSEHPFNNRFFGNPKVIISKGSQKELTSSLGTQIFLQFIFGPILTLIGAGMGLSQLLN